MIKFNLEKGTEKFFENIFAKLGNEMFIEESKLVNGFDSRFTFPADLTGKGIILPLIQSEGSLNIRFYKQNYFAWKMFCVNGYFDNERTIFINTRQLNRDMKDIEETCWHELVHFSEKIHLYGWSYNHGDNSLKGKDDSAPVKFAKWAANWKDIGY